MEGKEPKFRDETSTQVSTATNLALNLSQNIPRRSAVNLLPGERLRANLTNMRLLHRVYGHNMSL